MNRFVVAETPAGAAQAVADAETGGFCVIAGWDLPAEPWDLGRRRLVCTGTVGSAAEVERAVAAAARGVALVVRGPLAPELLSRLVDDLRRIGTVELRMAATRSPDRGLDPEAAALLDLLAAGATVSQAARTLHMSRRTAARRLAHARLALGVETNREAVVAASASSRAR